MLFFEPLFLFLAYPAFFAAYCILRNRAQTALRLLLVASVAFYGWAEPAFVPVVFASALIDYSITRRIHGSRTDRARRLLLGVGVAQNLAILIFYKYADFLLRSVYGVAGLMEAPEVGLALPVGVSFVVFEKISSLLDVYRGTTPRPKALLEYLLFVFFFPKLLAGPIIKYHEIRDQIAAPKPPRWEDVVDGVERFARGAVKKLLLADPIGTFVTAVFEMPAEVSTATAWLGLLGFFLQVYLDFSAYSDMAIGLARMLGFVVPENFMTPYIARSLTEFWRRWHISLSTWIRDYLYIPLGGSRRSVARTYANLWICFLVIGIWHGAAYNFVLWGAYNALVVTLERLFLRDLLERMHAILANLVTLFGLLMGFVIFRTVSLADAGEMYATLFNSTVAGRSSIHVDAATWAALAAGALICAFPRLPGCGTIVRSWSTNAVVRGAGSVALAGLFVLACARVFATNLQPFIYFRF
jgi:alginate O-acetyltransferase complex protein AlgI